MSKNYLDKRRYHAKHYYEKNDRPLYEWVGPFGIFVGDPKKDVNEPKWWSLHRFRCKSNHHNMEKYWYQWSKRKHRRQVRSLLKQGRYDELPAKPDNVDWIID